MDPFLGQINIFGFNFAPVGWSFANGALLSIQQYSALFSLLGTQFGGNGTNNFALPNLNGRLPLGQGNGAGLTPRVIGQVSGSETTTLNVNSLPAHTHNSQISATTSGATTSTPAAGAYLAKTVDGSGLGNVTNIYFTGPTAPPLVALSGAPTSSTGGSQPVPILNPFLVLNFSIALQGIFPSRN